MIQLKSSYTMMHHKFQYMVDFTLPEVIDEDFMALIPNQRLIVHQYFREGKLLNYALSLEKAKLWAIFSAHSEKEVMDMIAILPLTKFMSVEISILTFYNSMDPAMHHFSVN